ncbi:MAG: hypothetical protein N2381_11005 [Armatimonadetes bacterium]|nr:hypothetical protein [Armatimonadota bacterium]
MNKQINKEQILILFCIIDDVTKALGMQRDKQQQMSDSEVLTVPWISHQISVQTIRQLYLSLHPLTKPFS